MRRMQGELIFSGNSRHAARQLLNSRAVIEGEILRCDDDVAKTKRQGDCDKV